MQHHCTCSRVLSIYGRSALIEAGVAGCLVLEWSLSARAGLVTCVQLSNFRGARTYSKPMHVFESIIDSMQSRCKATHQMELSYPVSVCTVTCTVPSPFWEVDFTTP